MSGGTIALLATGIVGIVNFVMTIPAVLIVDLIGRKPMLIWGEANMAISHAVVAAIIAQYGGTPFKSKAAGNGAVFMSTCDTASGRNLTDVHSLLVHCQLCHHLGTSGLGCLRRGLPS